MDIHIYHRLSESFQSYERSTTATVELPSCGAEWAVEEVRRCRGVNVRVLQDLITEQLLPIVPQIRGYTLVAAVMTGDSEPLLPCFILGALLSTVRNARSILYDPAALYEVQFSPTRTSINHAYFPTRYCPDSNN